MIRVRASASGCWRMRLGALIGGGGSFFKENWDRGFPTSLGRLQGVEIVS